MSEQSSRGLTWVAGVAWASAAIIAGAPGCSQGAASQEGPDSSTDPDNASAAETTSGKGGSSGGHGSSGSSGSSSGSSSGGSTEPLGKDPGPRAGAAGAGGVLSHARRNEQAFFTAAQVRFEEVDSVSGTLSGEPGRASGRRSTETRARCATRSRPSGEAAPG